MLTLSYTLTHRRTGEQHTGTIHAHSISEALDQVRDICRVHGPLWQFECCCENLPLKLEHS